MQPTTSAGSPQELGPPHHTQVVASAVVQKELAETEALA